MASLHPFDRLSARITERRGMSSKISWTAKLLTSGTETIAKKVAEEGAEVALSAMRCDLADAKRGVICESADLLYHLLVLWEDQGITSNDVWAELERREAKSGLEEKQERFK